jgi:hypothetical protein
VLSWALPSEPSWVQRLAQLLEQLLVMPSVKPSVLLSEHSWVQQLVQLLVRSSVLPSGLQWAFWSELLSVPAWVL